MARKYGITIFVVYICIVLLTAIYAAGSSDDKSVSENTNQTNTVNETNVYNNFSAIAETEYNAETNNCTTKAMRFAEYLQSIGESPSIITINNPSGTSGHMAVIWRNEIYDPTMVPAQYGQPVELYLEGLAAMGYDGFTVVEPYEG